MSVDIGSAHGSIEIKTSGVLANVTKISAALRTFDADTKGIGKGFEEFGRSGEQAGQQVAQAAKAASAGVKDLQATTSAAAADLGKIGTAATIAGGAIVAALAGAGKQAASLQASVAKISTIAPEINTKQVESQLSGMSTRVAQSSTQLAESLNNIFSSIETNQADALKLTEEFGKGAVAASTDAGTFGTAVLGVMNAYGLSVDQASHISDVFFNTINKGVVSGDQLAHGLGQVTQAAKLAGVNFDTLGALIAGVTREGGDASTNINNLQNALSKISTPAAQQGLEDLGVQTKNADGSIRNIISVLTDLKAKLDQLGPAARSETLRKIFPDQQALAGVSTLLNQLDTINATLKLNENAVGSANKAYETMGKTAEAQAQLLKNTFIASLSEIGTLVLPDAIAIASKIRDMLTAFNGLDDGTKSVVVRFLEISSAALLLIGALGKVVALASSVSSTFSTISTAAAAMRTAMLESATAAELLNTSLASIALGGAAVAALAGVIAIAIGNARTEMERTNGAADKLAKTLGGDLGTAIDNISVNSLQTFFDQLTGHESAVDQLKSAFDNWANGADKATVSTETLQKQYDKLSAAMLANPTNAGLSDEEIDLRLHIFKLLSDELLKRKEINDAEKQRIAFLEEEQAAEDAARQKRATQDNTPAALEDQAAAINRVKDALTAEAEAQQKAFGDTQGPLSLQNLSNALDRYVQVGTDAIAVDAAQRQAKADLVNQLAAQQSMIQNTASAIAPLTAALANLSAKQAEGIPLTQAEADVYGQLPEILGAAQSATENLTNSAAATAISLINASGGVGSFGGAAGSSTSAIDKLRGSIILLNSALGALGQEDSQLQAFFNLFGQRIQVLQDAQKKGTITADQTAELNHLLGLQQQIGDQLGENAAKEREIAEGILVATAAKREQVKIQQAMTSAIEAAKQAQQTTKDSQVGALAGAVATHQGPVIAPTLDQAALAGVNAALDNLKQPIEKEVRVTIRDIKNVGAEVGQRAADAFSKLNPTQTQTTTLAATDNATPVIDQLKAKLTEYAKLQPTVTLGATDNATTTIGILMGDIDNIQDSHDTVLTATDNATQTVQNLINTINSVPGTLNVTANVDISGALSSIAELRANMPSSPAEKGPFQTLPDWSSVFASLGPAGEDAVKIVESTVKQMGAGIAAGISKLDVEGAKSAADFANSIAGAVTATVGATEALARLRTPNAGKITQLRDSIQAIISAFAGLEGEPTTDDAKKAAQDWNDSASSILSLVSNGVDSLSKLGTFERPTDQAVRSFRDVAQFVINLMTQVAADTSITAVVAAGVWADGAGKIFQSVGQGIDALSKLDDFHRPTDQAVNSFRDVAQYVVNIFAQVAADSELGPVADAGTWADSAIKVLSLVGTGVDALTKLQDFTRPTDQAVRSFRDVTQFFVNVIAQVAADSDQKTVEAAGKYADNASKIVSLIGAGVSAFKELTSAEFVPPSTDSLRMLADATRRAVLAIEEASADLDKDGVAAAGVYADSAAKVVSLIGGGIEGFSKLATLVPPSAEQIHNFKSVVSRTVIEIAQAAKELDKDAVKAAGEYADGAGKAVGLLGTAIGAFGSLDDKWVAPSKEAIQAVVNVTAYAVQQLAGIAGSFDKGLLAKLSEFGDAASSGFGAIRGALDAGKALEEDHIKPADAIGTVLAEFQAGLGPLGQLATVAQTYRTQGLEIGANIAQAYAAIGASVPGFSQQSQQIQANVTGTTQNVVIHQVQGGIDISFLGENGTWIVRSLQVDSGARHQVSDMIAEDISGIFADAQLSKVGA